jgi:hypothetical protein
MVDRFSVVAGLGDLHFESSPEVPVMADIFQSCKVINDWVSECRIDPEWDLFDTADGIVTCIEIREQQEGKNNNWN